MIKILFWKKLISQSYMPLWKNYLTFIVERNGPDSSIILRNIAVLIQHLQDFELKFFPNPGVANFRPKEFVLIEMFEHAAISDGDQITDLPSGIPTPGSSTVIPKLEEPLSLEMFFRSFPAIKLKMDELMRELEKKHGRGKFDLYLIFRYRIFHMM